MLEASTRQTESGVCRIALSFVLFLAACAARQTTPVAISQPDDAKLSCEQIDDEITRNEAEAIGLTGVDEKVVSDNIAAGVVGSLFLFPAILAIDLSNAEQIQFRALRDRNDNLIRIGKQRGC
jgi:hypothetical protein